MKRFFVALLEVFEVAIIAIGAVFFVRAFLVQPFLVSGASMTPSFQDGDYLLVDELTYRVREPQRGEVAVFRYPDNPSTFFIKRIIGLPGEEIRIQDGDVFIANSEYPDGILLSEPYLPPSVETAGVVMEQLGPDEYFLLGDNRAFSFDSRRWGPLPDDELVGLARLRLWPPTHLRVFAAPEYQF